MIEIIKEIWNMKWWEIFVIWSVSAVFALVKMWFIWIGIFILSMIPKLILRILK